jgi:hypothetical protein
MTKTPVMTPMLRLILEYARQRVLQLNELGYRPIAKSNSEYRHTLQVDENSYDRYNKACLLVEIAAGTKKDPADLYKLDKDQLVKAIDKALDGKRGK